MDSKQAKAEEPRALSLGGNLKLGFARSRIAIYVPAISATLILLIIGQILSPGFASIQNIGNLLALASVLAFAASGQTLVILSGKEGIDLSVGALMSMGALMGAMLSHGQSSGLFAAIVELAVIGGAIGAINAVGVQFLKIPPLIMTMGMATVVNGLVLAYTKGQPSGGVPRVLIEIGSGQLFSPIRYLFIIGLVLLVVVEFVLRQTNYGKNLYMIGSNRVASFYAGVKVNSTVFVTYVLAGVLGAVGGLVLLANVGSAQMEMGVQYTLLSVAAVIIGGTKLTGGYGTFMGSALGSILLVVLTSVLLAMQMTEGARLIIQGGILILILIIYSREPKLRQ